ncbi:MAG: UDP-N-acetylmuramoyl-tripeptide--D-alanyl-D-alanine ligase [Clostridia bacterium]|nr:UDP-N-acetylmuramoyl-tripeptide--D-alanyl-D-alanine ligase [Clostridia bacterium]
MPNLIISICLSLLNGVLLFFASQKFILSLQQSSYKPKRYFSWLRNKETPYRSRLMLLCLLGFLFFCVLTVTFQPVLGNVLTSYVGFISYLVFALLYIKAESSVNAKVPLKKTFRIIRLSITYILLLSVITFGLLILMDYLAFTIKDQAFGVLRYSVICILPIFMPSLLFFAYSINQPFESLIYRGYVKKSTLKLQKSDVLKIGITGSYGKTSVKEMLKTILSQKYRVLATPSSYNTPLGISLSVKNLDSTHDVFIAEMGARAKGDIATLTNIVNPKYGVLTGINNQHLETFGNIETTKSTKYELFEGLDKDGVAFFASDSLHSVDLSQRFNGEKYLAGIGGNDNLVWASDVVTDNRGTTFTLNIKGEQPVSCTTVLLGKHNVSNVCLAAAVAYKVGLSPEEIAVGINRIQSVGHRLELLPNNRNIVIIDDSYNSNEDGVNAAMEVLSTFSGRKIVVTPGLVELGKMENVANLEFGKTLAKHADLVFVIGKHNAEMLITGLLEGGMPRENIRFAKSLNKGNAQLNKVLKEGDVVLFENDLPDNYS